MGAKKKLKLLAHRLFSAMLALLFHARRPSPSSSSSCKAAVAPAQQAPNFPVQRDGCPPPAETTTLVVDVDTALLLHGSGDLFPYFMLVAVEAGGFLRGLVLLLLHPLLSILAESHRVKAMAAVAFCGLRAGRFRAGRAVLPKWFMEDVAAEAFDAAFAFPADERRRRKVVCVTTGMPRVMVEGFLREYLGADAVVGREMKTLWGFYTGIMVELDEADHQVVAMEEEEKDVKVGFSGSPEFLSHPLARCCCTISISGELEERWNGNIPCSSRLSAPGASLVTRLSGARLGATLWSFPSLHEVYVVSPEEKRRWRPLPRAKYPKPMVFHDGRLAFLPTATNTAAMFAWLPLGVVLGAARLAVALTVPYKYSTPILAATGMSWRLKGSLPPSSSSTSTRGQLFVCNHRTLIDPVYVSVALDRPVRAVSYSLSRVSELISPIGRTVRLTRDRRSDGAAMARLLAGGDLVVVCPEGTTCREPYLLRFSPLFAELADDVVPVGIAVETSMFYATTAGGLKCFDPLYYMVNPRMCYTVQFLERVSTATVRNGDEPSTDLANLVQRRMGDALGYGCTMLTRKDKYLMLAGNDGVVRAGDKSSSASATAAGLGKKKENKDAEKNN
ncbi:hypothetical protein EJB05_25855 [Eragrostis curvula]|uniref:Phospholipid/glycerol acyltransferase domain-containing protein n=1 Tax=Eragrostis curvula TaxID=38414 RepID=A0A5J9UIU8_9POAL|nr:hypothetical protein EJB05_25855 [Eragrostis curvula]